MKYSLLTTMCGRPFSKYAMKGLVSLRINYLRLVEGFISYL